MPGEPRRLHDVIDVSLTLFLVVAAGQNAEFRTSSGQFLRECFDGFVYAIQGAVRLDGFFMKILHSSC